MKSAQKGIEMKLIQILALAIAMATMATAQNSGANSQSTPTPSPTPTTAGKSGSAAPGTKKAASTGTQPAAKASSTTANIPAATKTGTPAKSGAAPGKPQVATTTTTPAKGKQPVVPAKGGPTPVVAAKSADTKAANTKTADTKKTEAKKADTKADTKKGDATKPASVIAVKPTQPTKKGVATITKAPEKTPAAKVTQAGPVQKQTEKPKASAKSFGPRGRRDPFVSPIVSDKGVNAPRPNCTNGKRCLVIPELILQGTIKDTSGKMMAVVANSTKRTYFLRENDQVFQGSVEKITSDSIIFREFVKDALGRETAREVVKKLVPAS
jgi:Tfp pilus assembly protein PilP